MTLPDKPLLFPLGPLGPSSNLGVNQAPSSVGDRHHQSHLSPNPKSMPSSVAALGTGQCFPGRPEAKLYLPASVVPQSLGHSLMPRIF